MTLLLAQSKTASEGVFYGNDFHPYTMKEISDCVANYFGLKLISIPEVVAWIIAYVFGVFKTIGLNVPLYPFRLKNIEASFCYDINNSVKLGYLPKYGLDRGLKETLDWYVKNDKDFTK
jgi:nucleoside-diphosphate-sugar epimerase